MWYNKQYRALNVCFYTTVLLVCCKGFNVFGKANSAIITPPVFAVLHISCLLPLNKRHGERNEKCVLYRGFLHIAAFLACHSEKRE